MALDWEESERSLKGPSVALVKCSQEAGRARPHQLPLVEHRERTLVLVPKAFVGNKGQQWEI